MKMKRILAIILVLAPLQMTAATSRGSHQEEGSQNIPQHQIMISSNLLSWAALGTLNLRTDYSIGSHWSLTASANWNPWTFGSGSDRQFQARQLSPALGARWWQKHPYKGLYTGAEALWSIYNIALPKIDGSPVIDGRSAEGMCAGGAIICGYTIPLGEGRWTLSLGGSWWGGWRSDTIYEKARCGRKLETREGFSQGLREITVSIGYKIH